jgi:hypothetical protein
MGRLRATGVTVNRPRLIWGARRLGALCALAIVCAALPAAVAPAQADPPHVMVFSGTYGFRHSSIAYGNAVLAQLAAQTGDYTVEFSENAADLSAAKLATVDLVLIQLDDRPHPAVGAAAR